MELSKLLGAVCIVALAAGAHAQDDENAAEETPTAQVDEGGGQAGGAASASDSTGQTAPVDQQEDLDEGAKFEVAEEHTTITLKEGGPHRLYVLDPVFPHLVASKVYVHDGDTGDTLGMMNTGYVPNLVMGNDHSELYVGETYWSRGTRGERIDIVTRYDPTTLSPTAEIELPKGRFLVVTKRHSADASPGGRYFYSFNLAPATSVSVIDLEAGEYRGEIGVAGCAMVFPIEETSFASICSDGSMERYEWDAESLEADSVNSGAFFDAENDPVFEHAAFDRQGKKLHLSTYSGVLYTVDLASEDLSASEGWAFVDDAARDEGWRPGGWQLMSYHPGSGLVYVIMHQGQDWTHKDAGEQVWELNPETQEVVRRIELDEPAMSIAVTADEQPLLAALSAAASIVSYDLESGETKAKIEGIGDSPFLIMVEGN